MALIKRSSLIAYVTMILDAQIVKICRIVDHRRVPNSLDQLFANANPNTNSHCWREVWSLLPKKTFFVLSDPELQSKRFIVACETLNPESLKQLSATHTLISFFFFHDFLAANLNFLLLVICIV